jgi:hypothetical protein
MSEELMKLAILRLPGPKPTKQFWNKVKDFPWQVKNKLTNAYWKARIKYGQIPARHKGAAIGVAASLGLDAAVVGSHRKHIKSLESKKTLTSDDKREIAMSKDQIKATRILTPFNMLILGRAGHSIGSLRDYRKSMATIDYLNSTAYKEQFREKYGRNPPHVTY